MKDNYKKAFTLAETLITLSILGVVAAVMVPSIIKNYQKRVTIAKLQKAYANLEKAATNLAVSTGCIAREVSCTGLLENFDSDKFIENTGLNIVSQKTGIARPLYLYCENTGSNCNSTKGIYLNGKNLYISKDNIGYAVTTSTIRTVDKRVNGKRIIEEKPGFIAYVFTEPKVISNWKRLRLGRNVFVFTIYDNFQVDPAVVNSEGASFPQSRGFSLVESSCDKTVISVHSGYGCAAKIIKDGWKINY